MGDGFYRSKDPTNSIKVLKEKAVKEKEPKKHKENTHIGQNTSNICRQDLPTALLFEDTMSNT